MKIILLIIISIFIVQTNSQIIGVILNPIMNTITQTFAGVSYQLLTTIQTTVTITLTPIIYAADPFCSVVCWFNYDCEVNCVSNIVLPQAKQLIASFQSNTQMLETDSEITKDVLEEKDLEYENLVIHKNNIPSCKSRHCRREKCKDLCHKYYKGSLISECKERCKIRFKEK
jgi:hypothetical protein